MKSSQETLKDYTHAYKASDFADYGVRYNILTNKTYCSQCGKELIQPKPTRDHPYPRRFCRSACAYRYFEVDKRAPHSHFVDEGFRAINALWNKLEESYNNELDDFTAGGLHRYIVREKDFARVEDDFVVFNWDKYRTLSREKIDKAIDEMAGYMHQLVRNCDKLRVHDILSLSTVAARMWFFCYMDREHMIRMPRMRVLRITDGKCKK